MNLYHVMTRGFHSPGNSRSVVVSRMPRAIAGAFIAALLGWALFYFWDRPGTMDTRPTVATAPTPAILTAVPHLSPDLPSADEARGGANVVPSRTDQRQREAAAAFADRMRRVAEEVKRAALKAAGVNRPVPLDQDDYIPMPGGGVWIKVHDNDVTGLDVSINRAQSRQLPKQEPISPWGTDETLIYSNGSASLFYVSQVNAGLDRCLLRVREN
ncbi:MAG TPA: hypothetical protein VH207_12750 [Chthoniobacterales bacterium]|jgi:hypothetical protein|nr:hypothetical protein [Chthoniobacterales bacterium]